MVLAAGYGTRLGGLSDERPKPLLPVCDQPLVRWAAQLLAHHGLNELWVNLHHLGELLRDALGERVGAARVAYSEEETILGTGGGIRQVAARHGRRETLIVANGKIACDVDLEAVLHAHRQRGALATLVVTPHPHARAWGAIGVDGAGRVARLLGQASAGAESSPSAAERGVIGEHLFTGIHVLEPELIDALPQSGPCCVVRDGYAPLFAAGAPLFAHVHEGYFYEHSTPERYLQGNLNLLADDAPELPARPGPLRGVHPEAELGPGVVVAADALVAAGAVLEAGVELGSGVVIGRGARIGRDSKLSASIVWPDVEVAAESVLQRVIATPKQRISVPLVADPTERPR